MKKKILTLFAMLFVCAALAFGFSACAHKHEQEYEHEHIYYMQVISENYLAEKATCTTKARYYYSCSCGEKGSGCFSRTKDLKIYCTDGEVDAYRYN